MNFMEATKFVDRQFGGLDFVEAKGILKDDSPETMWDRVVDTKHTNQLVNLTRFQEYWGNIANPNSNEKWIPVDDFLRTNESGYQCV